MNESDHERAKRFCRVVLEGGELNSTPLTDNIKVLVECYQERGEVAARLSRAQIELDLARICLRKILEKAQAGDNCLLCGEDFSDNTVRKLPECPLPEVGEFLNDRKMLDGLIDAIEREANKHNRDTKQ